jgi:hypothetical protein
MATKEKAIAIGSLILSILDLARQYGGKQKAQKIVGKKIFYESDFRGKWMINNSELIKLSTARLNKLTERVKKS